MESELFWRRDAAVLIRVETTLDAGVGRAPRLGPSSPAVEPVRSLCLPGAEELHLAVSHYLISKTGHFILYNYCEAMSLCALHYCKVFNTPTTSPKINCTIHSKATTVCNPAMARL